MFKGKLLALAVLVGAASPAYAQTVRAVFEGDLSIVDPHASTVYITRNLSNLTYDALFVRGITGEIKPQMVESWEVSADQMDYTFKLRDGLKFHDGSAVTAKDAVASVKRWAGRNWAGTLLLKSTKSMEAVDDKTFKLSLSKPFAHVVRTLSIGSWVLPERLAAQDPATPLKEVMGSGPFTMNMKDWIPGDKLILNKNPNYVSRTDAQDGLAGRKEVKFDRLELRFIADQETRISALTRGEIDFILTPSMDYIPEIKKNKQFALDPMGGRLGKMGVIVMNHSQPPFNNPKVRKAFQYAIDSAEIMAAIGVPPEFTLPECRSIFSCGEQSPYTTNAGAEDYTKPNIQKAKQLLAEAGYKGEKITSLHTTNIRNFEIAATVVQDQLRRVGFNVEPSPVEFNTLISKQSSKAPVEGGGWSYFVMHSDVLDLVDPFINTYANRNCTAFMSGFFCNEKITALRDELLVASDDAKFRKVATELQREFMNTNEMVFWGQFTTPSVYRTSIQGIQPSGLPLFWNVTKAGQ